MAKVASTPGAIGYVSLDVVDDTVKAFSLEGVEATAENIKAGNYFLSRPFVMATEGEVSEQNDLVKALFDYLSSADDEGVAAVSCALLPHAARLIIIAAVIVTAIPFLKVLFIIVFLL